ncbi:MAG: hypothetical protein OHK0012_04940 [Synechococcales cyanobacterium]
MINQNNPGGNLDLLFQDYFNQRGILPDIIAANGIRLSPPPETAKAVGDFLPAIRWDYGGGYQRYRFLGDETKFPLSEDGDPIKAKAPPRSGNRLYVPIRSGQSRATLEIMKRDPQVPLVVVEGEADTLGVLQVEGSLVVGIAGCWNWKSKDKPILDELKQMALPGRVAVLCPDSDWWLNPSVRTGWRRVGDVLNQLGCAVTVAVIPQSDKKLGAGDYVHQHGAEAWANLERIPFAQWAKLKGDPEPQAAEGAKVPPKDSPAGFYHRCKEAVFGAERWLSWNGQLCRWNGTYYEVVNPETIRRQVWEFAANYEVTRYGKDGSDYGAFPFSTPTQVKQAVEWLHLSCTVSEVNPPGINCENGFLELVWDGDGLIPTLSPHSPDRHVLSPPSCRYDPQADPTEYERLMQCLDPAPRAIWERTIAASLDLPTVRKYVGRAVKALLLKGDGANGKDTLRAICQQLLGSEAIANTSTTDWQAYDNGTYFKVADLRGKRLSWASETSDIGRIDKLQGLKAAITGDPVTFEAKYRDGVKEAPIAVFLFSINEMPNISNSLKAIESRWGLVPFNKTYSSHPREGELQADPRFKEDPNFIRDHILPAFLNRLLVQLQAVVREGIDYSATQGLLDEISREANHLQQFAQDVGLAYGPNSRIPVQQLWERLEQWYQDNGYLTYEQGSRGAKKAVWSEPARKGDRLVKGIRLIVPELCKIFPKARRVVENLGKGCRATYLQGICFAEFGSFGSLGSSQTLEPNQDKAFSDRPKTDPKTHMGLQPPNLGLQSPESSQEKGSPASNGRPKIDPNETQNGHHPNLGLQPQAFIGQGLQVSPKTQETQKTQISEKNSLALNGSLPDYTDRLYDRADDLGVNGAEVEKVLIKVTGIRSQYRDPLTASQYRAALELLEGSHA